MLRFITLGIAVAGISFALAFSPAKAFCVISENQLCLLPLGTEGVNQGVVCEVKDTKVISADAKSCESLGGKATHQIVTRAEEIKPSKASGDQ